MCDFPKLIEMIDHEHGIYEEVNAGRLECKGISEGANDNNIFNNIVGSME